MVNNVLCLASRATIGITASATADRLRDRNNSAEIGDDATGIVDIAAKMIPCKCVFFLTWMQVWKKYSYLHD